MLQTFRFDPDWLNFIRAAKAGGTCVFSDCRFPDFTLSTPGIAEFLSLTDIFSPNEDEAMGMTGKSDPEAALAALSEICPMVVMKRGRGGATVLDHGNRLDIPAPSVEVVDVTGAGDAFNAGFLFGMINDFSLEDSVRLAVLCGSKSTTAPGSRAAPGVTALKDFATANGQAALWSRRKHPSGSVDLESQISKAIPNHGGNSA